MSFQPNNLSDALQNQLIDFFKENDFATLYKSYAWRRDTYPNGFPDILKLEQDCKTARSNKISIQQIHGIAEWGGLANINGIRSSAGVLNVNLYQSNGFPLTELGDNPLLPLNDLDGQTRGLGPTYLTKVLRFCLPMEYGAIDTRIVRVFGKSNPTIRRHNWLSLTVTEEGGRFYISRWQAKWPSDYSRWINILRFFASLLNSSDTRQFCPHPISFVEKKLRIKGIWVCADIEMAIFSYASSSIHT